MPSPSTVGPRAPKSPESPDRSDHAAYAKQAPDGQIECQVAGRLVADASLSRRSLGEIPVDNLFDRVGAKRECCQPGSDSDIGESCGHAGDPSSRAGANLRSPGDNLALRYNRQTRQRRPARDALSRRTRHTPALGAPDPVHSQKLQAPS